jgi:hypothetical protein
MIRIDWWQILLILIGVLWFSTQAGCQSTGTTQITPEQHKQNVEMIAAYVAVAERLGAQTYWTIDLPTRAEFYTKTGVGSDGHIRGMIIAGGRGTDTPIVNRPQP